MKTMKLNSNSFCGSLPSELAPLASYVLDASIKDNYVGPTPCPTVTALISLYRSTGGPEGHWEEAESWMERGDPCDDKWYGVGCTYVSWGVNEVRRLGLKSNGLRGTVPSQIGLATDLTRGTCSCAWAC